MMYEHVCISIFHCLYFEKEIHLLAHDKHFDYLG